MSVDIDNLQKRLQQRFENSERLGSHVLKFDKRYGGASYASFYIDLGGHLQEKANGIKQYQDELLGPRFFSGPKSLQWNNYLCLVVPADQLKTPEILKAKNLFERDRSYARKFVVSEIDLDAFIDAPIAEASDADPSANILSVWAAKFRNVGAEEAVFGDDDLPSKIKLIENTPGARRQVNKTLKPGGKSCDHRSFIKRLELQKFRTAPATREFTFGRVNLIYGHNGTGKTSLFEAIEFFYCGRHKRNPDDADAAKWKIRALFSDGTYEVGSDRPAALYRQRNLEWYGQPEIKTNNLYQSFSRFNFFDTDAAVGFVYDGEAQEQLEENLSKLLVSADASQVWRNIERIYEEVKAHRLDARQRFREFKIELVAVQGRIDARAKFKKESELIGVTLRNLTDRLSWTFSKTSDKDLPVQLIGPLAETLPLLSEAAHLEWLNEKITIAVLRKLTKKAAAILNTIEPLSDKVSKLQKAEKPAAEQVGSDRVSVRELQELGRIVESGISAKHAELEKQIKFVSGYADLFSDERAHISFDFIKQSEEPLKDLIEQTNENVRKAQRNLQDAKSRLTTHQRSIDTSSKLAEELREVASSILEHNSNKDECPLCHTQHRPGELLRRMKQGLDENIEKCSQNLLKQSKEAQGALEALSDRKAGLDWLVGFCSAARLDLAHSTSKCVDKMEKSAVAYKQADGRIRTLNKEIAAIEDRGHTMERFDELLAELEGRGIKLKPAGIPEIDKIVDQTKQKIDKATKQIENYSQERRDQQQKIDEHLASVFEESKDGPSSTVQLRNWRERAETVLKDLDRSEGIPSIPEDMRLRELISQFSQISAVARDLQNALQNEAQAAAEFSDAEKRKAVLEKASRVAETKLERFMEVEKVCIDVIRNDSLTGAMQETIEENRGNIEAIFSRIHTPTDFKGLGSSIATLIRKADGTTAKLSQVSTGQRSAYVLSIFLALNSRLKKAPPLILIDDPIAHVDDLNTLSFLDYLRDIALTDTRQIFFATANDKIASLFERKFDFLGKQDFCRFDLPAKAG